MNGQARSSRSRGRVVDYSARADVSRKRVGSSKRRVCQRTDSLYIIVHTDEEGRSTSERAFDRVRVRQAVRERVKQVAKGTNLAHATECARGIVGKCGDQEFYVVVSRRRQ